jgi:hypothetical protein
VGLVRAPTIRSVPLTACLKLVLASVRMRSRVNINKLESAIEMTTQSSVLRRFQAL